MKNVQITTLSLINMLAYIVAIAVIITVYNMMGTLLAAISITGIVAWMLQVFAAYATAALGLSSAARDATYWFLMGIHKVFYNDEYTDEDLNGNQHSQTIQ